MNVESFSFLTTSSVYIFPKVNLTRQIESLQVES